MAETKDEAVRRTWHTLEETAEKFVASARGMAEKKALADAAEEYTKARWAARTGTGGTKPSAGAKAQSGVKMPFGRKKDGTELRGLPIEEADTKDLKWVAGVLAENIQDPARAKWKQNNERTLAAIEAELATR